MEMVWMTSCGAYGNDDAGSGAGKTYLILGSSLGERRP